MSDRQGRRCKFNVGDPVLRADDSVRQRGRRGIVTENHPRFPRCTVRWDDGGGINTLEEWKLEAAPRNDAERSKQLELF